MSFELPEEPVKKEEETKPKGKGLGKILRTGVAAVAVAAAGVGIHFGSEFNEKMAKDEQERANAISLALTEKQATNPEKEKEAKEKYEYFLHNYYVRTEHKGDYIIDEHRKFDMEVSGNPGGSLVNRKQDHARALEIAIKSGLVNPDITGWEYLWGAISFKSVETPPDDICFGNTKIPFQERDYTETELTKFRHFYGEAQDGGVAKGKPMKMHN